MGTDAAGGANEVSHEAIRIVRGQSLGDIKKEIAKWLVSFGIEPDEARTEAEIMVEHVISMSRSQQFICKDLPLSETQLSKIDSMLNHRRKRVPIQYLTEEAYFMGLTFKIRRGVFIPRPDTEALVEIAMKNLSQLFSQKSKLRVLEIGVGSGAICVSLLKKMPDLEIVGIDLSDAALALTRENAAHHQVLDRLKLIRSSKWWEVEERYDAIVSNPPYIPLSQSAGLQPEVGLHEPKEALFGGDDDGLSFYRELAERARVPYIAVEVGDGQADAVCDLFKQKSFEDVASHKDLNGLPRVVTAQHAGYMRETSN